MDVPSAIGNHVSATCNRQLSFVLSKFAAARASTMVVARHKSAACSLLARTHPTTASTFPHTVQLLKMIIQKRSEKRYTRVRVTEVSTLQDEGRIVERRGLRVVGCPFRTPRKGVCVRASLEMMEKQPQIRRHFSDSPICPPVFEHDESKSCTDICLLFYFYNRYQDTGSCLR